MEYRFFSMSLGPTSKLLLVLIFITIYTRVFYQLPISSSMLFGVAVFIIFFVPGDLVLSALKLEVPFEGSKFIYSIALGLIVVTVAYTVWRYFEVSTKYLYLPFICAFVFWVPTRGCGRIISPTRNLSKSDFNSLCVLVMFILGMLHFTHFTDVILTPEGFDFRFSPNTETVFHQGLINALVDNYPPAELYASGITDYSFYHMGMHLHIELVNRLFNIPTQELIYYYFAFLYFFLLSALSYSLARSLGGNWISSILAGALIFGSDFSYIPGIYKGIEAPYVWDLIFIPGIFNLFTYNGIIPGLISLLVSFILFNQYCKHYSLSTLFLIIIVVLSAYQFKYSLGLHLNLALVCIGVLMSVKSKFRSSGIILAVILLFLFLVMLFGQHFISGGLGNNIVQVRPFNMLSSVLEKSELSESPLYLKAPLFFVYFVLALGVRYLGYHVLVSTKWNMKCSSWGVAFVLILFLSGYSIAELFFIGVEGGIDNSIWFATQGMFAAWVLVFYFVIKAQENRKHHLLAVTAITMLAFPSTIQLLEARGEKNYIVFNKDDAEVITFIKKTKPASVFLHPISPIVPSLASNFGGRSSVLNNYHSFIAPFMISSANRDDLISRFNDIETIFTENTSIAEKNSVLDKYKIDYMYCPNVQVACKDLALLNNISLVLRNHKYSVFSYFRESGSQSY